MENMPRQRSLFFLSELISSFPKLLEKQVFSEEKKVFLEIPNNSYIHSFKANLVAIYDFVGFFWLREYVSRQYFPPQLQLSQQAMLAFQT